MTILQNIMAARKKVTFEEDRNTRRSADEDDEDNEDIDPSKETLIQRLAALIDIVPIQRRRQLAQLVSTATFVVQTGTGFLGSAMWILSTTALIVLIPLGIELEKEQQLIQFENDQKLQQLAAQQLLQPANPVSLLLPPTLQAPKQ